MTVPSVFLPYWWERSGPCLPASGLPPVCAPVDGGSQIKGTGLCVCGFPVDFDAEVSILSTKHCTIQEWQTVVFHVLPGELNVLVRHVDVSGERFHFLGFDLNLCVIHIPKPAAGSCSSEGVQSRILHVEVNLDGRHRKTHGTTVFLYVKNIIVLEICWGQAKVQKFADLVRVEIGSGMPRAILL